MPALTAPDATSSEHSAIAAHELARRIDERRSALLREQDLAGIVTNYGAVGLVVWVHWEAVEHARLLPWAALWLATNTAYLVFSLADRSLRLSPDMASRGWHWARLLVGNVLSTAPAGLVPWLLSPSPELLHFNTALLVIYLAGVYASTASVSPLSFMLAGAGLVVPTALVGIASDTRTGIGLGAALTMCYLFLIPFAFVQARGLRQAIAVGLENEELARQLTEESAQAQAATARAEAANRAKARFLAAATHDLRQPLHAMSLTLESMDRAGDELDQPLARARESARQLSTMFDALLDQARLDAGTRELAPEPVALAEIFRQVEAQFASVAGARGLWLRCRPTRAVLRVDRLALWRIVSNLVTNALEATGKGGVLVAWRAAQSTLEVRDSGRGIPAGEHAAVFEEFRRLPDASGGVRRGPGLGLGLANVRGLATLMGARVVLRSAPGRGSVFGLRFAPDAVLAADAAPAAPAAAPETALRPGLRVLAVDDEPSVLAALRDLLLRWGLDARVAASAAECRRVVAEWLPEVVLLDGSLGDTSGLALAGELRATLEPAPACLLVTGDTYAQDLEAFARAGLTVLHKPVGAERLRAALAAAAGTA
jgi:signal transduction histidine kinase/CheY-like chemotaxis protein